MDVVQLSTTVAAQAANTALLAHGVPGGAVLTQALLGDLLRVQDQQAEAIRRIEGAVERLLNAPWNTARMYLNEAAQEGRTPAQVQELLAAAARKLREAVAQQEEKSIAKAHACLDLTLVLRMLGDNPAAALYAKQVVPAASEFLRHWMVENNRKRRQQLPLEWYERLGTGEPLVQVQLLSAQSIVADPVLVWADPHLTVGSAESRHASQPAAPREAVRERLRQLMPAAASPGVVSRETQSTGSTRKYIGTLWRLAAGTDLIADRAKSVDHAKRIAAWNRQRVRKRELGLEVLRRSDNRVAFSEFEAIREAADQLDGVDPSQGPWLFYSLDPTPTTSAG